MTKPDLIPILELGPERRRDILHKAVAAGDSFNITGAKNRGLGRTYADPLAVI
jgi:hypothetical protein